MRQPNLAEFCDLLLNPTPEMAAAIPVPLSVLADDCLDLALRFRAMIKGILERRVRRRDRSRSTGTSPAW